MVLTIIDGKPALTFGRYQAPRLVAYDVRWLRENVVMRGWNTPMRGIRPQFPLTREEAGRMQRGAYGSGSAGIMARIARNVAEGVIAASSAR